MTNNVQIVIDAADLATMTACVTTLEGLVQKYVKPLTPEERQGGLKLGDKSVAFAGKLMEYARLYPTRVPEGIDLAEVERDFALLTAIGPLARRLSAMGYDLESTAMLAGGDVMGAALKMYAQNQLHAQTGVPGAQAAVLEQQERFPGRGKSKQAE
jgi:hypothetical protein